jgi:hypothetical protein
MPTAVAERTALVPGDAVRAAALLSLVVGTVALGGVAGALFLLVLGGLVVPRALGVPTLLDVAYGACLLVAAWAAQLAWYDAVTGLDLAAHAACTALVAAVAHAALVRGGLVPEPGAPAPRHARWGTVVVVAGLGAAGAVLWEVGEWAGHTYLDDAIGVGYADTVTDLAAGVLGALVAGLVLARAGGTQGRA